MRVLVLNPGSSTLKAAMVHGGALLGEATVEWPAGEEDAAGTVAGTLERLPHDAEAVGYRVVHGGSRYRAPAAVDSGLLAYVEELDELAPLHNRRAAAVMRAGIAALPDLRHVACFDTAFHASLPEPAWRYPLPAEWVERFGIRRFGFHGLSVAWSVRRTAELLDRRVDDLRLVVAHLGSGCSVTAVDGGRSVETSMGLTPYEGLMMGTRSGSVDPGILLHLLEHQMKPDAIADGLAHASGLLAVSGSADAKEIGERARSGDRAARLALEMFAHRAAAGIAAAATALSALDAIVFTGGIGTHAAAVRSDIVARLATLHVPATLGEAAGDGVVAAGPPSVVVVEAREDLVIAEEVAALLG